MFGSRSFVPCKLVSTRRKNRLQASIFVSPTTRCATFEEAVDAIGAVSTALGCLPTQDHHRNVVLDDGG